AGKNAVENNHIGQAIVKAAEASCNGDKACEDKVIWEGINSYNETIIEYGEPQVIVIGGLIAAPIAIDIAGPAIASCTANPVLCANNVGTWLIETVGFEGYPAAGLGMTAGSLVNSLSKSELNELAAIMELYKNNRIENPSVVLNEIKTTLSENANYKIVYDRANNTIVKQTKAGKGTTNGATQLPNGKWVDAEGLPLPVPPSIGASGRVPKVLQNGGNTLNQSTANALNKYFDENINKREWGRALESLKKDNNIRNDHHGRILDNGDYINSSGNVIGNIGDYLK
ncbi:hypothetical protein J3U37_10570, partial [Gilliamella sp. B3172]